MPIPHLLLNGQLVYLQREGYARLSVSCHEHHNNILSILSFNGDFVTVKTVANQTLVINMRDRYIKKYNLDSYIYEGKTYNTFNNELVDLAPSSTFSFTDHGILLINDTPCLSHIVPEIADIKYDRDRNIEAILKCGKIVRIDDNHIKWPHTAGQKIYCKSGELIYHPIKRQYHDRWSCGFEIDTGEVVISFEGPQAMPLNAIVGVYINGAAAIIFERGMYIGRLVNMKIEEKIPFNAPRFYIHEKYKMPFATNGTIIDIENVVDLTQNGEMLTIKTQDGTTIEKNVHQSIYPPNITYKYNHEYRRTIGIDNGKLALNNDYGVYKFKDDFILRHNSLANCIMIDVDIPVNLSLKLIKLHTILKTALGFIIDKLMVTSKFAEEIVDIKFDYNDIVYCFLLTTKSRQKRKCCLVEINETKYLLFKDDKSLIPIYEPGPQYCALGIMTEVPTDSVTLVHTNVYCICGSYVMFLNIGWKPHLKIYEKFGHYLMFDFGTVYYGITIINKPSKMIKPAL